ncbi:IS200/IS605 family transposase [Massilibacterium senegalense]|uniref:IS200/IS605 family transposase n=1 Tax=Massilibacterium senegalense TaxID=1632858 RepID=UPI000784C5CE|nr:IS200/IS605 family transposase [Massilibacterium senegalense]
MKLDNNNYSVFLLYYYLVLVVKYCRKVMDVAISDYAKDMFVRLGENDTISLVEWNHDMDHVHMLFKAHPNTDMSKFINAYKSASSRLIKKHFPQMKKKLWKEYFWSRNFRFLTTVGASIEVIKK